MPDEFIEHSDLELIGAASVPNKWAIIDGNVVKIARGRVLKRQAASSLAARQLVYVHPASGKFALATTANRPLAGLITENVGADEDAFAQYEGIVIDDAATPAWNWTPYAPLYAHPTTPGALTQTPPGVGVFSPEIGLALSATIVWLYGAGLTVTADSFGVVRTRAFALDAASALVPSGESSRRVQVDGANMIESRLLFAVDHVGHWKHAAHPAYQGSDLTVRLFWRANALAGNVRWQVAWNFGREPMAWDGGLTTVGEVERSAASAAPTPSTYDVLESSFLVVTSGHKPTAGDLWWVRVKRIAATGEMIGNAELVLVVVEYSVDS